MKMIDLVVLVFLGAALAIAFWLKRHGSSCCSGCRQCGEKKQYNSCAKCKRLNGCGSARDTTYTGKDGD